MKLTIPLHLVPLLRMYGAVRLLLMCALGVWTGNLYLYTVRL
jgi:hypothetical protein